MGNKVAATNVAILNAVRSMQSLEYRDRIPEATAENISSIYENLLNIVPLRNAFANALVEQIMEQRIETVFFENPLGVLKRDPMRYGGTEEEIFINMAKVNSLTSSRPLQNCMLTISRALWRRITRSHPLSSTRLQLLLTICVQRSVQNMACAI